MGEDDGNGVGKGFWLTQAGREDRHSDGAGGEAAMLFTMLHHFGWVDVGIQADRAVVRLNPSTACAEALHELPLQLAHEAPHTMVELVLIDQDAEPVDIAFLEPESACRYLDAVTSARGAELGEDQSVWGSEAFPMPLPYELSETLRYPLTAPMVQDPDEQRHVDEERFARSLTMAEWLAPVNTADSLKDRRLVDRTPEMVSFALRSLGWVGIKRKWSLHGQSFRSSVPEVVALDPMAIRREALNQLVALCEVWAPMPGEVTFAWWNGMAWVREKGRPLQLADRLRTICRIAANDEALTRVDSVEVPIQQILASGQAWAEGHPFAVTLTRWQEEQAGAGAGETMLRDLERLGLFQTRTKLLIVDANEDLRIARYAPGRVTVWDDRANRAMEGSRLIDVPDRGLGLCVQRDLRAVQRRREPVLHRCNGVVAASDGLQVVQWSRLTVPLFMASNGEERVSALLSTCELEHASPI
ncbi:hypothetical protein T8K17_01250 [Thalassobaculum sp. OXR-137]|uniref:hypothetical protein n=1 Tax=Thalassobaculum sp. OXR-137 TaxID=3100173 RepID=UPI002AC9E78F|nr:hypothetical protein [Thalassobaculum sp. OXR-137]WPZ34775.1 hypothetical protein T8K17_01250 [Thalassobaculum sp. OXR-137]